jgi:hypothetical protein
MAYGLIYEFPNTVGEKEYNAVNEKLGIDSNDPKSNWPKGLLTHSSGKTSDGVFWLYESWDSKASQQAFMDSRLGPALGAVGVPAPAQLIELDLINNQVIA